MKKKRNTPPRRNFAEYEAQKAKLAALLPTPSEYERGIRKLAAKLKL